MEVTHNPTEQRFEIRLDGERAELQYRIQGQQLYFLHTWVPEAIAGRGLASQLARAGLDYARQTGTSIVVLCPFVRAYLQRHPEYHDLPVGKLRLTAPRP
ncbi:hypothetical protein SAMN05421823_11412 [Catalinimonas alkaloidigena]|uniref:N-acetyltransferase domain-containing protein n=1 Tax=Catalinimonas alkaloidigena TaxID=1075417 RepID=A0A1G9TGC0_9BACT|nr:GNAT family N-acetyltransferase [Catalinimonas alkaloidigena]SDM46801.1 hypothetical protein SAMN05421823_11412 [Catalinimonas alkaloidigena]